MQNFSVDSCVRLDVFLAKKLNQSRNQVSMLIKDNHIKVNNQIQNKASFVLKIDDEISVQFPKAKEIQSDFEPKFDIEILYEDEYLLVLNKPPLLTVHGASSVKEATLVDWLMSKNYVLSTLNGINRAGLVHRLDKGTSGAIVIAKDNHTHQKLSEQLQDKSMGRYYLALIDLPLKEDKIIAQKALARSLHNRMKKISVEFSEENLKKFGSLKNAKTAFINLLSAQGVNLIAAKLFTGRTHQIRAHLADLNRHILGDELYGYKGKEKFTRVMLHAYFVYFFHPKTKEKLYIKAPLFDDFDTILKKNYKGEENEKISLEFITRTFGTFV
ncbi:RluA family pseudouridine synthase [Campylobacter sp. CCS1377]|uniref:Pseudouridine synthase n=1 Tax=Campylobacter sp. CCS1377 TaxID=3158229 RepID=A0AAU7E6L6_9BACT